MSGIYENLEPGDFERAMRRALTADQIHRGTNAGWASIPAMYDTLRTAYELGRAPELNPQTPRSADSRGIDDVFPRGPLPSLAEEGALYHTQKL